MSISFIISRYYKLSAPPETVVGSTWGAAGARIGIEQVQPPLSLVRDEGMAGSNPATPRKSAGFRHGFHSFVYVARLSAKIRRLAEICGLALVLNS
jgi:hypothetical protein